RHSIHPAPFQRQSRMRAVGPNRLTALAVSGRNCCPRNTVPLTTSPLASTSWPSVVNRHGPTPVKTAAPPAAVKAPTSAKPSGVSGMPSNRPYTTPCSSTASCTRVCPSTTPLASMSSRQASTRFGPMKRISMLRRSEIDCSRAWRSTAPSCELPLSLRAASTTPGSTMRAVASSVAATIATIKTSSRVNPCSRPRLRMYVALPRPCTLSGPTSATSVPTPPRAGPPHSGTEPARGHLRKCQVTCKAVARPARRRSLLRLGQRQGGGVAHGGQHPGGALLEVPVHEPGEAGVLAASSGDGLEEAVVGLVEHLDGHVVPSGGRE